MNHLESRHSNGALQSNGYRLQTALDLCFVELTQDPAYTAGRNPDAQRWHELAQYDLGTADAMLSAGRYLYVLFCCQQAIEKHLKGTYRRALRRISASHA